MTTADGGTDMHLATTGEILEGTNAVVLFGTSVGEQPAQGVNVAVSDGHPRTTVSSSALRRDADVSASVDREDDDDRVVLERFV